MTNHAMTMPRRTSAVFLTGAASALIGLAACGAAAATPAIPSPVIDRHFEVSCGGPSQGCTPSNPVASVTVYTLGPLRTEASVDSADPPGSVGSPGTQCKGLVMTTMLDGAPLGSIGGVVPKGQSDGGRQTLVSPGQHTVALNVTGATTHCTANFHVQTF
jgi:hypothetical protein